MHVGFHREDRAIERAPADDHLALGVVDELELVDALEVLDAHALEQRLERGALASHGDIAGCNRVYDEVGPR